MLGKRHRDSTASNVTGVIEVGQEDDYSEDELAKRVVRPTKKRAKISQEGGGDAGVEQEVQEEGSESGQAEKQEEEEDEEPGHATQVPGFTVFSGPDEPPENFLDPAPPTTHLPEFYAPPSPESSGGRPSTSTAHASENQNPFSFSFLPLSSTPANPMYPLTMPSFPYPEPPQSPSPAGPHGSSGLPGHPGDRASGRSNLFQPFGMPTRPRSRAAGSGSGSGSGSGPQEGAGAFVNPAALTRPASRAPEREVSSNEVAAGLGLTAVKTSSDLAPSQDAPPMKRTMYGTELDGDTRFGDFGVEGVATGFWAGGRF